MAEILLTTLAPHMRISLSGEFGRKNTRLSYEAYFGSSVVIRFTYKYELSAAYHSLPHGTSFTVGYVDAFHLSAFPPFRLSAFPPYRSSLYNTELVSSGRIL